MTGVQTCALPIYNLDSACLDSGVRLAASSMVSTILQSRYVLPTTISMAGGSKGMVKANVLETEPKMAF